MQVLDTRYFQLLADDDNDSVARASAIAETCDADLVTLEQIFSTNFRTGSTMAWPISVYVRTVPGKGGAVNHGYRPGNATYIAIFDTYSATNPGDPRVGVEFAENARVLFVAELAEILMEYTGLFWPGDSSGEGLSIYLASWLHPQGYYLYGGNAGVKGPRIINWLQTPHPDPQLPAQRQDWVSNTDPTDKNFVSFGCALLFFHYLVSQLHFPIEQVIQASMMTMPLSYLYAKLTSNPASQAFSDFADLIEAHLPLAKAAAPGIVNLRDPAVLGSDNIFPLQDIAGRKVYLSTSYEKMVRVIPKDNTAKDAYGPQIVLKPGRACLPSTYFCWLHREIDEIGIVANCAGLLSATIEFKVNGVALAKKTGWDTVTVPAETTFKVPDHKRVITNTTATIQYNISPAWNSSTLWIRNTTAEGTFTLEIIAAANETAVGDPLVFSDSQSADITALTLVIEDRYYHDRKACDPTFYAIGTDLKSLSATLSSAFNKPYPPPDGILVDLINAARELEVKLSKAANESGLHRSEILHECSISGDTKLPTQVATVRSETSVTSKKEVSPVISQLLVALGTPPAEPPSKMFTKRATAND